MADAAAVDAAAEMRLAERARASALAELREECARTKAAARPDAEGRRRAIHEQRFLRSQADAEGAWNLRVRNNPEVGAEVMAAVDSIRDRLFREARAGVATSDLRRTPRRSQQVAGVAHLRQRPTAHQQTALSGAGAAWGGAPRGRESR